MFLRDATARGGETFKQTKKLMSLIVAGLACTTFAGCRADDSGRYHSADEATREYAAATKEWSLAPGATWPEHPYLSTLHGGEAMYEKGSGKIDASFDWWCSWALRLKTPQTDEQRRETEMNVLRIRETPFYQGLIPKDRSAFNRDVVYPAMDGNFAGASVVAEQNCTQ